jgi:hypothetical protein
MTLRLIVYLEERIGNGRVEVRLDGDERRGEKREGRGGGVEGREEDEKRVEGMDIMLCHSIEADNPLSLISLQAF